MSRTKQSDKRARLVKAADTLIYHGTFHTTTLADIAKAADVPLGNVYYYFKTKEMIMCAVITTRSEELKALFSEWEQKPSLYARLEAFIAYFVDQTDNFSQYGCPIGSLCQELSKLSGNIGTLAAKLMHDLLHWAQNQFHLAHQNPEKAQSCAEHLLSSLEGMALLTLTFKNKELVHQQSTLLSSWVREQVGNTMIITTSSSKNTEIA